MRLEGANLIWTSEDMVALGPFILFVSISIVKSLSIDADRVVMASVGHRNHRIELMSQPMLVVNRGDGSRGHSTDSLLLLCVNRMFASTDF